MYDVVSSLINLHAEVKKFGFSVLAEMGQVDKTVQDFLTALVDKISRPVPV